MNARRFLRCIAALGLAGALGACQQKNTADQAAATSTSGIPAGIERFLLFPNPVGAPGAFETDSDAYASAYYRAIDPNNDKDTLDKWKTANGFGGGTGTEHLVVFKDEKDLGYGRRMTGRMNTDGTIAFFVENYNVTSGSSTDYSSSLNVEAAIARDTRWHVGTNAIEWSAATCVAGVDPADCNSTARFAKFYNFSSADGTRQKFVNLDGKGMKAMPGPCITCHGGRGDPLTPPDALNGGLPRFPLVENSVSRKRGDVQARMHGMNVASFGYSAQTGWTRAEQEASLKAFNQWMACTYPTPVPGATVTGSWGTCTRPTAGANEWQGTAFELIEAWYGGAGMPQGTFTDTYVPAGWSGNPALYTNVVAPYCRTCHVLRGTGNQSDLDFTSLAKFQAYADRIKAHVFDRGNMPLALIVYDDFWESSAPQQLAQYIDSVLVAGTATDSGGAALKPGRPIADPGPDRMVRTGANAILSGENSLFATSYSWSLVSGSATITYPNSAIAVFEAASPGQYIVRLTVSNGAAANSKDVTITVDDNFPDPLNIRFAQVKNVLQKMTHTTAQVPSGAQCVQCHVSPPISTTPPVFYNDFDRDGSGGVDTTDEAWFVKAIRGRVNLTDIQASPLLRKPTGNHHNGLMLLDVADTSSGGGLRNFSVLYNWILAGMLPGGVAANAGANSSNQLTFSGAPLYASVALDGSQSTGATSYLWTVLSGPNGPTGATPIITNPSSALATLNVPNVGTYVVRLLVSNGVFSDTSLRTITVTETPITASFNPLAGSTPVTFSGNPLRGDITLDSTSSGNPAYCQWQANGPAGATLDGVPVPAVVTTLCSVNPIWRVPSSGIGTTNNVTLTAFGIASSSITQGILVADGTASVVANLTSTTTPQAVSFTATGSNMTVPTHNNTDTGGFAGNISVAIVGASVSLNGSASTTPPATILSYSWCLSAQPDQANFPASIAVCPSTTSSGNSATTTMTARATGSYTVQLTVTNGLSSHAISRVIQVNPSNGVRFSDFTGASNNGFFSTFTCLGCHGFGNVANTYYNPTSNNVNGWYPQWDNVTGIDGTTLYQRVRQRVNLGTPTSSLLLLNPNNVTDGVNTNGHGGGCIAGFPCSGTSTNYNLFLNWISDGAPPGN